MTTRSLLVLALVTAPAVAHALQLRPVAYAPPSGVRARVSPPLDSARVQSVLARADEATYNGKVGEARRLYGGLIREQRAAEQFAGTAMWRLALNYLYADDVRGAAEALDELGAEANRYGDPAMELRASFEAGILWQKLGRTDHVMARVARVRELLQSPAVPSGLKAEIRARM